MIFFYASKDKVVQVFFRLCEGGQNKSKKVAVVGDSVAVSHLR